MTKTDFNQKIKSLSQDLNLSEQVTQKSIEICQQIREIEDFKYSFVSFGGFDAMIATSICIAAKQNKTPLPPQKIVDKIQGNPDIEVSQNFSNKKLNKLAKKFTRKLEIDPVFLTAEDYINHYTPVLNLENGVKQQEIRDEMYVSEVAVRYTYKEITENLTGVDTTDQNLSDVEVTKQSFGYHGNQHDEFAKHVIDKIDEENLEVARKSPQALAASTLYIASKLI